MVGKTFRPLCSVYRGTRNDEEVRFFILVDFCNFW